MASKKLGFTIAELMVVIAVFGIGILLLSRLIASIQYAQQTTNYLEEATQAAKTEVEKIRNSQFDSITDGTNFNSSLPSTLPAGSTGLVKVTRPGNAPASKQVEVTVTYKVGELEKKVSITAYIDPPAS